MRDSTRSPPESLPLSPDSSSASASQDALDTRSVKALTAALRGVEMRQDEARTARETSDRLARTSDEVTRGSLNALRGDIARTHADVKIGRERIDEALAILRIGTNIDAEVLAQEREKLEQASRDIHASAQEFRDNAQRLLRQSGHFTPVKGTEPVSPEVAEAPATPLAPVTMVVIEDNAPPAELIESAREAG